MDADVFKCPNCAAVVDIDLKTRKGFCEVCGSNVVFPRKRFNSSDKVTTQLTHLVNCFTEKRFLEARNHALEILSYAYDNVPALYARAYYDAFVADVRNLKRIDEFFNQTEDFIIDAEEVEPIKTLLLSSYLKLSNYEEDVLDWLFKQFGNPRELLEMIDTICPALILRRSSIEYFYKVKEFYMQAAQMFSIPKTCYALLKSITTNPDSPFTDNSFFLKTKTQRFLNDYVVPIGEIIQNMANLELREKFYKAFLQQKVNFVTSMND